MRHVQTHRNEVPNDDDHGRWGRGRPGGRGQGGGSGGGGRGPSSGRSGPRRGRARRGEVRSAVLALLAERPMHGYEMIQQIDERTGGLWKPSPGSVYPTLALLEDEGFVTADQGTGKRCFTLTDAGREDVAARGTEQTPWEAVASGVSTEERSLRQVVRQLGVAARQVAEAGDEAAKSQAAEILVEARKKLYAVLADAD